jgi:hypothetical protein
VVLVGEDGGLVERAADGSQEGTQDIEPVSALQLAGLEVELDLVVREEMC